MYDFALGDNDLAELDRPEEFDLDISRDFLAIPEALARKQSESRAGQAVEEASCHTAVDCSELDIKSVSVSWYYALILAAIELTWLL